MEQVPLKMFPITISKGWQADDLIVLSSYHLIVWQQKQRLGRYLDIVLSSYRRISLWFRTSGSQGGEAGGNVWISSYQLIVLLSCRSEGGRGWEGQVTWFSCVKVD